MVQLELGAALGRRHPKGGPLALICTTASASGLWFAPLPVVLGTCMGGLKGVRVYTAAMRVVARRGLLHG